MTVNGVNLGGVRTVKVQPAASDRTWQTVPLHVKTAHGEVLNKLRQGRDVLLNVDVQGAASIRTHAEEDPELKKALVTVFLTPPSLAVLEDRLKKRGTDSPAEIRKRLSRARQEITQWKNFDYLLISASIPDDLRRMLAIVEAEKMRSGRGVAPEL